MPSHLDSGDYWQANFPDHDGTYFKGLKELALASDKKGIRLPDGVATFPFWRARVSDNSTITSNKRSDYANTPTLIVDIDGCLANWNERFFELLLALHGFPPKWGEAPKPGASLTVAQPTYITWNWPKTECGYTNKQIDAAWDRVDDIWWNSLPAYPGVEDALQRLHWLDYRRKAQVVFCTGRYPSARFASTTWLSMHGFACAHVITTSAKLHIAHAHAANGPVSVIEDKPTLLEDYKLGPVDTIYCIDQPYNRDVAANYLNPMKPLAEFIRLISAKDAAIDYEKRVSK
jgi:hypothetical protein